MPNYGDPKYWEERYREQEGVTFDWLEDYVDLRPVLQEVLSKDSRVLVLGCGNSELSEQLYDDGIEHIESVDISSVVIEQMRSRSLGRPGMAYKVMDIRELSYEDNTFDSCIDKGTLDSLLCSEQAFLNAALALKEAQRVLKPGGYYIMISYGRPEDRLLHLQRSNLSFDIQETKLETKKEEEKEHIVYVCRKRLDANEMHAKNWVRVEDELRREYEEEAKLLESEEFDFEGLIGDIGSGSEYDSQY